MISDKKYTKRSDAKNDIELIIKLISKKNDFKYEIISQNNNKNKFPENFNHNNELNIIFPEWPSRFQNVEFKKYIKDVIDYYIPANIRYNIYFLSVKEMIDFTLVYKQWKNLKSKENKSKIDIHSLKMIQLLINFNEKK